MPEVVISIYELSKKYGETVALDRLNLEIPKGKLFGLLGPNGAGKTTVISILCGLIPPNSGSATVCGFDTSKESGKVREP